MVYTTRAKFRKAVEKVLGYPISLHNWETVADILTYKGYHEPIQDDEVKTAAKLAGQYLKALGAVPPDDDDVPKAEEPGDSRLFTGCSNLWGRGRG
jgi:hypothetical protein